jgi:hypothetical protein
MRAGPRALDGLTLAEVLIAAGVLAVALLGIAGAFPTAYRQVSSGGQLTKATNLGHQMMEALLAEPPSLVPRYSGRDGHGVVTDAGANFPDDWPWPCGTGWSWPDQFCGNSKLARWRADLTQDGGDGRVLARARGTVTVGDHERPLPAGGGPVTGSTTLLRVTVTVSWDEGLGHRQVTFTSVIPCGRPGCG